MLGLAGKNRLAVYRHDQYARSGEAHLGRQIQLLPDFPLEAPGLEKSADSGHAPLDFNVHDLLRFGDTRPAPQAGDRTRRIWREVRYSPVATLRNVDVACDGV